MDAKIPVTYYSLDINSCSKDKINHKLCSTPSRLYYILNYDKLGLSYNDTKTGIYRSVIFSFPEKEVLSYSPPKSIPLTSFMDKNPVLHSNIYINESIEGVMIHLFYDNRINKWEIATKCDIGGYNRFYNNKNNKIYHSKLTVYEMFLETFRMNTGQYLNDIPLFQYLPTWASYTFILKHPAINMIIQVEQPVLYLVAVYSVFKDSVDYIPQIFYEKWSVFKNVGGIIEFPKQYNDSNNYGDLFEKHGYTYNGLHNAGLMITNMDTGERSKLESSTYEDLKKLKSIQPFILYQFLCLQRISKDVDYILHFPKQKKQFFKCRNIYNQFITNIHQMYLSFYVHKNIHHINENIKEYSKNFTHIHKIHKLIYLPSLKTDTKIVIRRNLVKAYFDKMEPRELMFILNME